MAHAIVLLLMKADHKKTAWRYADDLVAQFPEANSPQLLQKMRMVKYAHDHTEENEFKRAQFDALLLIDVQERYCNPEKGRGNADTAQTAKHIGALVPHFRKAGLPIYSIFFKHPHLKSGQTDFYHYRPASNDHLHMKRDDSAFTGCSGKMLDASLKNNRHKNLLIMGFNATACLLETVNDARKLGYNCTIAADAIGNDDCCGVTMLPDLRYLFNAHCVSFISAAQALQAAQGQHVMIPAPQTPRPADYVLKGANPFIAFGA